MEFLRKTPPSQSIRSTRHCDSEFISRRFFKKRPGRLTDDVVAVQRMCLGLACPVAFRAKPRAATQALSYCLASRMFLIATSDFSSEDAVRPTATFRTMDPLTPVSPACSEPIALIR